MDSLFHEQRLGYELALDRLIRDSEPSQRKLRVGAFCSLEDKSERDYANLMMLSRLNEVGLGRVKATFLENFYLDREITEILNESPPNGAYNKQAFSRERAQRFIDRAYSFIDDWNFGIDRWDSERSSEIEENYRLLMIDRQITSRGLSDAISIESPLEDAIRRGFSEGDYTGRLNFSINYVNSHGNPLGDAPRNLYLLVNQESCDIDNPFPASSILQLRDWGIIGRALDHAFMHFPVVNYGPDSKDGILSKTWVNGDSGEYTSLENHRGVASEYFRLDRFQSPKVAIAPLIKANYVQRMFEAEGAHVITV